MVVFNMNPLTNVKNIKKLSEQELKSGSKSSWHDQYSDSAWIFIGGLPYDLTEGDVVCVFSQYGEVVNINLVRDKATGKSRGFCFVCYEDQRSTALAVDNLNSMKLLGRTIRVDHVKDYKVIKDASKLTKEMAQLIEEGCATTILSAPATIKQEIVDAEPLKKVSSKELVKNKPKDERSKKSSKKKSKKKRKDSDSDSDSSSTSDSSNSD